MHPLPPAIFLMGPTASGKTAAAVNLVAQLPVELISVDSALVFQGMNIGTAKPDAATLAHAPHHLIDLIPPTAVYSAAQFRTDALRLMAEITAKGKVPVLVGGTMLYFKALIDGLAVLPEADLTVRAAIETDAQALGWPALHARLARIDPLTAARLQPADSQRIERALEVYAISGQTLSSLIAASPLSTPLPYRVLNLGLIPTDRAVLHARINARFITMLEDGLLDELRTLQTQYPLHPDLPSMRCVGYRQAWQYLAGEIDAAALQATGQAATRQLAKRQLTWLRSMPDVHPIDCDQADAVAQIERAVAAFLQ